MSHFTKATLAPISVSSVLPFSSLISQNVTNALVKTRQVVPAQHLIEELPTYPALTNSRTYASPRPCAPGRYFKVSVCQTTPEVIGPQRRDRVNLSLVPTSRNNDALSFKLRSIRYNAAVDGASVFVRRHVVSVRMRIWHSPLT